MFDHSVLAFALIALALTIAPGPDTFLVIANTGAGGFRRGFATVLGIVSGGFFYVLLVACGLIRVLVYSPALFHAVKLAGACYLLYLGWGALRGAFRQAPPAAVDAPPAPARSIRASYLQGLLTNALNPKIAVFYLAFLPQFLNPGDPVVLKSALLIGIHYFEGLLWLSLLAFGVGRLGRFLARPRVKRTMDAVLGTTMMGFGVKLAVDQT
ncbi:MAG: LysE family translocator [Nevskia sp.]|nr:LysE family translocator [Nevskia sp.]